MMLKSKFYIIPILIFSATDVNSLTNVTSEKSELKRTDKVQLYKSGIKCNLPKYYGYTSHYYLGYKDYTQDFCNSDASVNLTYKIEKYGSKIDDGKFIIITVSPEEGSGSGWSLTRELFHGNTWYESAAHRYEAAGPIASRYIFSVYPKNNGVFQLIKTLPQNTNPETKVEETRGASFGLSAKISGDKKSSLSPQGPSASSGVGLELGGTIQSSNTRKFSYDTKEYFIENASHKNIAEWQWNSKIKSEEVYCNYLSEHNFDLCYYSKPLFSTGDVIRTDRLSAISHKSFTPTFQAVYKAPRDATGKVTFMLSTSVEAAVLLGITDPRYVLAQFNSLETYTKLLPEISTEITVDLSDISFEPEENIYLKNTEYIFNDLGLTASENINIVSLKECLEDEKSGLNLSQIWGYDENTKQLKSRVKHGYCLSATQNKNIIIEKCSNKSTQQWTFDSKTKQLNLGSDNYIGVNNENEIILINSQQKESAFKPLQLTPAQSIQ